MKTLIAPALLSAMFLMTPGLQAAAPADPLRLLETSPQLIQTLVERYPDEVRALSKNTILLPSRLVPQLSQIAHETTGHCGGFMDITEEGKRKTRLQSVAELPQLNGKKDFIVSMVADVRADNIRDFDNLYAGQFKTRYAGSTEGESAPKWLVQAWKAMAEKAGRGEIIVELVPAPKGYKQNSVRITIPGADPNAPIVVLGAHLDSINRSGENAPGQDDDASGIATLTEVYRIFLAHNVKPHHTVQIFGYAAEELGLLGSRVIAQHYQEKGVAVRGVLQLDMTAYPGDHHKVTFMTDNVDAGLTQWTQQVYGLYVGSEFKEDQCGYGCSDHASWNRYGYPAVMPFESGMEDMNHRIHSERDVWDSELDADYAAQFAKLALGFAAELSN